LAVGFCSKYLAFARKIMGLPEYGGCMGGLQHPHQPSWLVRLCIVIIESQFRCNL